MTTHELRTLMLEHAADIDFPGHFDHNGNLRHCNRSDCDSCPFSNGSRCLVYEQHNPAVADVIASIYSTNPEFFI